MLSVSTITLTITIAITLLFILFPFAAATNGLVTYPTSLDIARAQVFHLRYECPSDGCQTTDEISLSILYNNQQTSEPNDSITLKSASITWGIMSDGNNDNDYSVIEVTNNEFLFDTNNAIESTPITFTSTIPPGTITIAEIVIYTSDVDIDIDNFYSYEPDMRITITPTPPSSQFTLTTPFLHSNPAFTPTKNKNIAEIVPIIKFRSQVDGNIDVDSETQIPVLPLAFQSLLIHLPICPFPIRAIRLYPLFGIYTDGAEPNDIEINNILYPIEVKIDEIGQIFFEIDNIDEFFHIDYFIKFPINFYLTKSNPINTIHPITSQFGLIISFYTIPISSQTVNDMGYVYTHWYTTNPLVNPIIPPQDQSSSLPQQQSQSSLPLSSSLPTQQSQSPLFPPQQHHSSSSSLSTQQHELSQSSTSPQPPIYLVVFNYYLDNTNTIPTFAPFRVFFDPVQIVTQSPNGDIQQYDGVNNHIDLSLIRASSPSSSQSPTTGDSVPNTSNTTISDPTQPYRVVNAIHESDIFTFNTNNEPDGLTVTQLVDLYFNVGIQWDNTTFVGTELYSASWMLYTTISYDVQVNETHTHSYTDDVIINSDNIIFISDDNLDVEARNFRDNDENDQNDQNGDFIIPIINNLSNTPSIASNSSKILTGGNLNSKQFRLLPDDVLDNLDVSVTGLGLFTVPQKIHNASFTITSTSFILSFDFTFILPIEITDDMTSDTIPTPLSEFSPTIAVHSMYKLPTDDSTSAFVSQNIIDNNLNINQSTHLSTDKMPKNNQIIKNQTDINTMTTEIIQPKHPDDLIWFNYTSIISIPHSLLPSHTTELRSFVQQSNNINDSRYSSDTSNQYKNSDVFKSSQQNSFLSSQTSSSTPRWDNTLFNGTMILYPHNPPIDLSFDGAHFANIAKENTVYIETLAQEGSFPQQPIQKQPLHTVVQQRKKDKEIYMEKSTSPLSKLSSPFRSTLFNLSSYQNHHQKEQILSQSSLYNVNNNKNHSITSNNINANNKNINNTEYSLFDPLLFIDESTPAPPYLQYTFEVHFYTTISNITHITLSIPSSQYVWWGSFVNCTLNGRTNTTLEIIDLDGNELIYPNMYQKIILKVPTDIDLLKPQYDTLIRIGLDGVEQHIDPGPNPPNKLVCMHPTGTILQMTSLYTDVYTDSNDNGGSNGGSSSSTNSNNSRDIKYNIDMDNDIRADNDHKNNYNMNNKLQSSLKSNMSTSQTTPETKAPPAVYLPYFNPNLPTFSQLPVVFSISTTGELGQRSSSPSSLPPINSSSTSSSSPRTIYELHYSFTMITTIPPMPEAIKGTSKKTWLLITIFSCLAMLVPAGYLVIRFIHKTFFSHDEQA